MTFISILEDYGPMGMERMRMHLSHRGFEVSRNHIKQVMLELEEQGYITVESSKDQRITIRLVEKKG